MKLIKLTDDHYVIVDDSPIQEGDWMYLQQGNTPSTKQGEIAKCEFADANNLGVIWKKISHSTNILTNGMGILYLSEVKELIVEVDVKKKAEYYYDMMYFMAKDDNIKLYVVRDYVTAYNQAIEDNKEKKYTEEDVIAIVEKSRATGLTAEYIIQSLQQTTQWDVEFDSQGKLRQQVKNHIQKL